MAHHAQPEPDRTVSNLFHTGGALVLLTLFHLAFQSLAFSTELRPDEYKAIDVFTKALTGQSPGMGTEIFIRLVLASFNLLLVLVLHHLGLITRHVAVFCLIWPMTLFLFSKIYWEFFVFPLCLIRYDLRPRSEALLIAVLAALSWATGEGNVIVLALFRTVLFGQKIGFRRLAPLGFVVASFVLSILIDMGVAAQIPVIGGELARFGWTRTVANPEYSIIETAAVFFSSMHFFTIHTNFWWIDAIFSALALCVIFRSASSRHRLWATRYDVLAVACVVLAFTEISHAFQNARYYYFFVPALAAVTRPKDFPILALLGIGHVLIKSIEML